MSISMLQHRGPLDRMPAKEFLLGLDLGKKNDYTALTVVEQVTVLGDENGWIAGRLDQPRYDVSQIFRAPKGMAYPRQVAAVKENVRALQAIRPEPNIELIVDQTGVGQAVCDLLTDADLGCTLTFCTITGADSMTHERGSDEYRVPKRDLASSVAVLLESDRLKYAAALPYLEALQDELKSFQVKINPRTGHDQYGNASDWRTAEHDDLVLSLCLACWRGENRGSGWTDELHAGFGQWLADIGVG